MTNSSKVSLGMICLVQWRTTLTAAVSAAAVEPGFVDKFEGEPDVAVDFAAGIDGASLGKQPRLPEARPVKCQPTGACAVA